MLTIILRTRREPCRSNFLAHALLVTLDLTKLRDNSGHVSSTGKMNFKNEMEKI
jgi:hypothetical protein